MGLLGRNDLRWCLHDSLVVVYARDLWAVHPPAEGTIYPLAPDLCADIYATRRGDYEKRIQSKINTFVRRVK